MSSLAAAPALAPRWPPSGRTAARGAGRLALDLLLFALLAAFALAQWARLFTDPPAWRLAAALGVCCAAGVMLGLLARAGWSRRLVLALAFAAAFIGTLAALVVAGLPARLLAPGNWGELAANLGDGLGGIANAEMPYDGERVWTRLALLLGAPLLLGLAAGAAFWPARRPGLARAGALALVLAIYGIAVTLDAPGSELLWGAGLLLLAAAWLWLPAAGLRGSGAVLASAAIAGGLALPLAASLDPDRPWWDYESWNWFTSDETTSFDWNHKYGPLDWPQDGTTMLEARSERPLYWKTSVLDRFDGFTWQRADPDDALAGTEVTARAATGSDAVALSQANPEWLLEASIEVRDLRSDFVVGAGTPLLVQGFGGAQRTSDGTVLASTEPLESGEEYSIVAYSPQPNPTRMRLAPEAYPATAIAGTTLIGLPAEAPTDGLSGFGSAPPIEVPPWGAPRDGTGAMLERSVYGDMYALARELTAHAPTAYDAVTEIERHLRDTYDYTQTVPDRTYPLVSFLFEDVGGYCQQFSGAMALMLRMVGIPTRVVSGFAPGRYVAADDLYEVSDTDAHSWVEVYFTGIGWVPFDPTPAAAPAAAQVFEEGGPVALPATSGADEQGRGLARSIEEALEGGSAREAGAAAGNDDAGSPVGLVAAAALAAAGLWSGVRYARRRRRLHGPEGAELQARELIAALGRLGWRLPPAVTLRAIEQRFAAAGRNPIASYARALGRHRYEPGSARPPGPGERRALRRAVGRGGPRRRWRALRAVPPGGPGLA